jgi:putative oxidoreductase
MHRYTRFTHFLDARKDYAIIALRMLIGWRLIDGTQDNVFSAERMLEFRDFLNHHGVIYPLIAAYLSVYAQFLCGIFFIAGAFMRLAAIVMVVNFIAALLIAHIGLTFEQSFDAWAMLAAALYFIFSGAGKISVDEWIEKRNKKVTDPQPTQRGGKDSTTDGGVGNYL